MLWTLPKVFMVLSHIQLSMWFLATVGWMQTNQTIREVIGQVRQFVVVMIIRWFRKPPDKVYVFDDYCIEQV